MPQDLKTTVSLLLKERIQRFLPIFPRMYILAGFWKGLGCGGEGGFSLFFLWNFLL